MAWNQVNMLQSPFGINPINNQMKNENPMIMKNMMNNQIGMNNMMMNNQIGMNNMMSCQMGVNDMMNNQMRMNNMMMNNQIGMNNMMNNQMGMHNMMMNNQMGMNNMMMNNQMEMNNMMMNNQMGMNNMMMNNQIGMNNMMMNNQIGMNNMMNIANPMNNQMMMNQELQNQMNMPNKVNIPKKRVNHERKIPDILLKNKNKKIESITFQVEKDKKPTNSLLGKTNTKEIFNRIFLKRKQGLNEKGKLVYLDENEPMEILHYKFDTDKNEFFNYEKKSLIQGLVFAYKNHFPITVSPDMIWLLILQGYSRFMDKYHEL